MQHISQRFYATDKNNSWCKHKQNNKKEKQMANLVFVKGVNNIMQAIKIK